MINGLIACLSEFFVIHVYGPAKVLNGAIDCSRQTAAIGSLPRSPDGKSPCQSRAAIPGNFWEKEENCKIVRDGSPREKSTDGNCVGRRAKWRATHLSSGNCLRRSTISIRIGDVCGYSISCVGADCSIVWILLTHGWNL